MLLFLLCAAALICGTLLLLLRPWKHSGASPQATTSEVNAGIYRDQLGELDRDLAAGTIGPADHQQARAELQRRLLEDVGKVADAALPAKHGHRTAWALALGVPLLAAALYAWRGTPIALDERLHHQPTAAEVDQMISTLAARLEKNPDNPKGWTMLARSYRALGRTQEAKGAYARIGDTLNNDPALLAEYADVLATLSAGQLEGKPTQLVARALELSPGHPLALSLAAAAAFQRRDVPQAIQHWERLLAQLPPESENAQWLANMLATLRKPEVSAPATASQPQAAGVAVATFSIKGKVSLAPALANRVQPDDTVFVFARPSQGSRMPLAIHRARAADLPFEFTLDDSMAMNPQAKLSSAAEVSVEARISRSGNATPAAGDLFGTGPVVRPGSGPITLQIDKMRP